MIQNQSICYADGRCMRICEANVNITACDLGSINLNMAPCLTLQDL